MLLLAVFASGMVALNVKGRLLRLRMPTMLSALVGATAISVSFQTNSGYDQLWKGRKLWGESSCVATQLMIMCCGAGCVRKLPSQTHGCSTASRMRMSTR